MRASARAAARRSRRARRLGAVGRRDHDHDLAARLGAAPHSARQARARSPRRTSSCSLVSSRQTAASRAPSPAARSASVAASRGPLSNSTRVAGMRASSPMRVRRAAPWRAGSPRRRTGRSAAPRPSAPPAPPTAPGAAVTAWPASLRLAHQLEARVGDQRRAGIRDQRDGAAGGKPLPEASAAPPRRCGRDRASAVSSMP